MLQKIFEVKREEAAAARLKTSEQELKSQCSDLPSTRGFERALSREGRIKLIAEVKRASPSEGLIRDPFDVSEIASAYQASGASCLSVLTDSHFFQGSPENLAIARKAASLPILRKDFIESSYQVYETRSMGADALLLIAAWLEQPLLEDLHALSRSIGLDVLVEVHSEQEAERALEIGASLIGVNNRDLDTFKTSLSFSQRILPLIHPHATAVSESALQNGSDISLVRESGADAVLIGTVFCRTKDIGAKVREVMMW